MLYPGLPGMRLPWDRDGTALFAIDGTSVTQAATSEKQTCNDETDSGGWTSPLSLAGSGGVRAYGVLFPTAVTLDGLYFRSLGAASNTVDVYMSSNSTDGLNGDWAFYSSIDNVKAAASTFPWRTGNWRGYGGFNTRAIRFHYGAESSTPTLHQLHVYGYQTGTYNYDGSYQDRVKILGGASFGSFSPTYFEWGDTPRNSSLVFGYLLENLSSSRTANNTVLSIEALTDSNPSQTTIYGFSQNINGPFTSNLTIPSIAPQGSTNFYVRRSTPSNMALGPWMCRMVATPASFS